MLRRYSIPCAALSSLLAFVASASAQTPAPEGPTAGEPFPGDEDTGADPDAEQPMEDGTAGEGTGEAAVGTEGATTDIGGDLEDIESLDISAILNMSVETASGGVDEARALASANVTSVGREEILTRGYRSVGDVLAATPGLYVIDDLVTPSVAIRGVSGELRGGTRLIKVMINGMPVNFRPDLTAFIGSEYIPIEAVERVEIAKGPLSALYGANAFLGVVNIVTRKSVLPGAEVAGRLWNGDHYKGNGISGAATYGGEYFDVLAGFSFDVIDRSGLNIEQTFDSQDPSNPGYAPIFQASSNGSSRDDVARPVSGFGQFGLYLEKYGTVRFQGGVQRLDSMGEFQPGSLLTHASRHSILNLYGGGTYDLEITPRLSLNATVGVSQGGPTDQDLQVRTLQADNLMEPAYRRNFDYRAVDARLQVQASPLDWLSLRTGIDYTYERHHTLVFTSVERDAEDLGEETVLAGRNPTRVEFGNLGADAQVIGQVAGLRLTGNLRLDIPSDIDLAPMSDFYDAKQELFDNQISFRAALAYRFSPRIAGKVIVGQAFQTPSGVLLLAVPGFGPAGGQLIGNRTSVSPTDPLRPQRARSAEGVVSLSVGPATMELSAYIEQVSDRIVFEQAAQDYVAGNDDEDQIGIGGEVSALAAFSKVYPYVRLGLHENRTSNYEAAPLGPYPRVFAIGGMEFKPEGVPVNFLAEVKHVGERGGGTAHTALNDFEPYTLPSYTQVNLSASTVGLLVHGDRGETKLMLSIRNLLDERHYEPGVGRFDLPTVGRVILFELRQLL
jgi:iron complex outermembrane receptor protein